MEEVVRDSTYWMKQVELRAQLLSATRQAETDPYTITLALGSYEYAREKYTNPFNVEKTV